MFIYIYILNSELDFISISLKSYTCLCTPSAYSKICNKSSFLQLGSAAEHPILEPLNQCYEMITVNLLVHEIYLLASSWRSFYRYYTYWQ